MKRVVLTSLTLLPLAALSSAVEAQEFCVSCVEPNATYRCVIADPRPGASQPLQMACLTALAKDGNHAQCTVKRGVTVFECDAPVKRVSIGPSVPPTPGTVPAAPVVIAAPPPPAPDPNAPPTTVVEAMKRAKQASDANWQKNDEKMREAGNATATFFKNTFTCLGSLFTKCGTSQ